MTPAEAEQIYYDALRNAYNDAADWCKPVVQREAMDRAWAAVIDAIERRLRDAVEA